MMLVWVEGVWRWCNSSVQEGVRRWCGSSLCITDAMLDGACRVGKDEVLVWF